MLPLRVALRDQSDCCSSRGQLREDAARLTLRCVAAQLNFVHNSKIAAIPPPRGPTNEQLN